MNQMKSMSKKAELVETQADKKAELEKKAKLGSKGQKVIAAMETRSKSNNKDGDLK